MVKLSDSQLSVNARFGWSQYATQTDRKNTPITTFGDNQTSSFNNQRNSQYYASELGFDWQKPLDNHWIWRVINLNNTQNWFVDANVINQQPIGQIRGSTRLRFDEHKTENILRTSFSQNGAAPGSSNVLFKHLTKYLTRHLTRQEFGAEFAFSDLESWLKIDDLQAINSTAQTTSLQNSYSKAQEKRSEIFANFTWGFNDFTIETGIGIEHSALKVKGDSQSVIFVKPSLNVIYNSDSMTQYRFSLRRNVGQLDFSDYAASADLTNSRQFSGNPQLKPDTNIEVSFAFDYSFDDLGALNIEIYHQWRQDVLEQIVLPSGDLGLGNVGDATGHGLKTTVNLPLDIWLSNGLISLSAHFYDSSFDDPITGLNRNLTQITTPQLSVDFRQDLAIEDLSWGFGYQAAKTTKQYFVSEHSQLRVQGNWQAFIEYFVLSDYKIRLNINNIGDDKHHWRRYFYQPSRAGMLLSSEQTH